MKSKELFLTAIQIGCMAFIYTVQVKFNFRFSCFPCSEFIFYMSPLSHVTLCNALHLSALKDLLEDKAPPWNHTFLPSFFIQNIKKNQDLMSSYIYFCAKDGDLVTFSVNIWCFKVLNSDIAQAVVQRKLLFSPSLYITTEGLLIPSKNRISENKIPIMFQLAHFPHIWVQYK